MRKAYVVTGGGRGIGRAIVERLLADGHAAVALELDAGALGAVEAAGAVGVVGDAADEAVAERAAEAAADAGTFAGWVNNAAVFRDASVHEAPVRDVLALVEANLAPALVGCAVAVRRFLAAGGAGSIVNVSSHQAQRAVAGATPYATAKAAIEGLTRALAVEYGARGIRVNAVALGSIETERYGTLVVERPEIAAEMARLHPLGRPGRAAEVAAAVAYLLSDDATYITGAVVPVDGGRAAKGQDPEERR